MTEIRISGPEDQCRKILEDITPCLPEILEVKPYDRRDGGFSLYVVCMEPLQAQSIGNVQDWSILEYCQTWRRTPDIKRYFKLEYEQVREICDRMYMSGALCRRLSDNNKSYEYIDSGKAHRCLDCRYFQPTKTKEEIEKEKDWNHWIIVGHCSNKNFLGDGIEKTTSEELRDCEEFKPIQEVLL